MEWLLFLNILIALEITQNITSYLSSHIIQIEMVIITSLIAVARKIIILDFEKISESELFALAATIFALSICYWFKYLKFLSLREPASLHFCNPEVQQAVYLFASLFWTVYTPVHIFLKI